MNTQLLTTEGLREKYNIAKHEKSAKLAHKKNADKLHNFVFSKQLEYKSTLEDLLKNCIYYLILPHNERKSVDKNLREFIRERNKKWINRISVMLKDRDLCIFLGIRKDLVQTVDRLNEILDWLSNYSHSGYNQPVIMSLAPVVFKLKDEGYKAMEIVRFLLELFIEFDYDHFGKKFNRKNLLNDVKDGYYQPIIKKYYVVGRGLSMSTNVDSETYKRNYDNLQKWMYQRQTELILLKIQ